MSKEKKPLAPSIESTSTQLTESESQPEPKNPPSISYRPKSRPQPTSKIRSSISNKLSKRFPQFSSLPVELRLLIWQHALPGPRVHELHPCSKLIEGSRMMFRSNHSTPPIVLSVCRESREVALAHYQLMIYEGAGTKGIRKFYFDPRADTLFLNTLIGLYMAFMLLETELAIDSPLGFGVMKGWQNIALDADRAHLLDLLAGHGSHAAAPRLKAVFPDLRKFTVACDFTRKGKTRFRTSVWPGENGTKLKLVPQDNLSVIYEPMVRFMLLEWPDRVPEVDIAKVKRKTYLRGDLRYLFRKGCNILRIRPSGVFMRL